MTAFNRTELRAWNNANQAAMDAYAEDKAFAAGLCIVCHRRPLIESANRTLRRCWACRNFHARHGRYPT